jgi:protein-export membrane protein SecD
MKTHIRWLIAIVILTAFCIWLVFPTENDSVFDFDNDGIPNFIIQRGSVLDNQADMEDIDPELEPYIIKQPLGLDLVGGLRVLLQASIDSSTFSQEDLVETANNVSRRVNSLGLTEATVQVQGDSRILVELPGVTNRERAIATIQQTALLEFVDFRGLRTQSQTYTDQLILTDKQIELGLIDLETSTALRHPTTGQAFSTGLTGSCLSAASAQLSQANTGATSWSIQFEIAPDCVGEFAAFTQLMINEPMAIVLDGRVISAPTVQSQLSTGGVITGEFTQEESQQLALQLRSGALPIPLRVESSVEVGATLGQKFLDDTIRAGIMGTLVVFAFMLIYYRVPGIAADLALVVFILLNLAVFRLTPVTLTLPAITGFLISIGTAVDGNILIFERVKEEVRAGKSLDAALNDGFDRAWQSIRDSNISTIIICGILFLFGQTPGASIVSGFAVTLAIGLILNLFTAITVTRTFLYLIVKLTSKQIEQHKWLIGV